MNESVEAVMVELEEALADERGALMRFDAEAVEAVSDRKAAIAERLGAVLSAADEHGPGERARLLRMLSRVRWAAEANRALLNDASELLSSVRAMPSGKGTYERRACMDRAAPALPRYGT